MDGDAAITAEDTIAAAEATGLRRRLGWDKEPGKDRRCASNSKGSMLATRTMPSEYGESARPTLTLLESGKFTECVKFHEENRAWLMATVS